MKILTIAATSFFIDRGCSVRIYNEAKYLQELGVQVRICTYHNGRDISGLDISRVGKTKLYNKTSPGFSWGKGLMSVKLFWLCLKEIRKFQPDVIHAHMYEALTIGYWAKKILFRRIPIVVDLQGDLEAEFASYNKKNSFAAKIFVWLSKRFIRWADHVVLSSEKSLGKIKQATKSKITIIRDGVDTNPLTPNPLPLAPSPLSGKGGTTEELLDEVREWKGDNKMLIYTGGLVDGKGVGELLKNFDVAGWKLLLAGDGQHRAAYEKYITDNNLSERIKIISLDYFIQPALFKLADIAIDPKKDSSESSAKLMTYMAAGKPIICFDNKFNRERLQDQGLYIKNISELSGILQQEISAPQYDLDEFGEEKEVERLYRIFKNLILNVNPWSPWR